MSFSSPALSQRRSSVRTVGSSIRLTGASDAIVAPDDDDTSRIADRVEAAANDPTGRLKLFLDHTEATSLPSEIGNLLTLRELYLSGNARLTALPSAVGHLWRTLCVLDCRECALESLPPELEKLVHLKRLDAAKNKLTTFLWDCSKLAALEHLDVSDNCIEYFSPTAAQFLLEVSLPPKVSKIDIEAQDLDDLHTNSDDLSDHASVRPDNNQHTFHPHAVSQWQPPKKTDHARVPFGPFRAVDVSGNGRNFVSITTNSSELPAKLPPNVDSCEVCGASSNAGTVKYCFVRFIEVGGGFWTPNAMPDAPRVPRVRQVPILYPCCGPECATALHSWCQLRRVAASHPLQAMPVKH